VFEAAKRAGGKRGKKHGSGRYSRSIGLGFKTPKAAMLVPYVDRKVRLLLLLLLILLILLLLLLLLLLLTYYLLILLLL
jgi:hypothetical protein